jgi:hypothetical protein
MVFAEIEGQVKNETPSQIKPAANATIAVKLGGALAEVIVGLLKILTQRWIVPTHIRRIC